MKLPKHLLVFAAFLLMPWVISACESEQALSDSPGDRIWIARPDGSKSCESDSGRDLRTDEGRLKDAGVPVFESKKGDDGLMHTQVCGADTGKENRYLIPGSKLSEARKIGFEAVRD